MDTLIAPVQIVTDRLLLRSWMPGDGAALSEATNTSYDHLRMWMPWARPHQEVATSERLCRQFRGRWLLAQDFVISMWSPDGDRVLGGSGFHLRHGPLELGVAEMGMWVRADAAGEGLGTHALQTMLQWGFTAWPWQRLVWKCDIGNMASQRVAERADMVREGITRGDRVRHSDGSRADTVWYAALRQE